MALDSTVAFAQRAQQCGLPQESINKMREDGIATFAQYAFCCTYQPGGMDESSLFSRLKKALGSEVPSKDEANFRRLFFESHALALSDLKTRLERTEHSEAKVLPLAEKVDRVNRLKQKLSGLIITPALEPSHALIDKAVQQFEENNLRYLELSSCTSREQEILNEKTATHLSFDEQGHIKVSKKSQVSECSLSGELRLRAAFQRRALAYDLANVATYHQLETWTNTLFEALQKIHQTDTNTYQWTRSCEPTDSSG